MFVATVGHCSTRSRCLCARIGPTVGRLEVPSARSQWSSNLTHVCGVRRFLILIQILFQFPKGLSDPTNPIEQPEYIALCFHFRLVPSFIMLRLDLVCCLLVCALKMCSRFKHLVVPLSLTSSVCSSSSNFARLLLITLHVLILLALALATLLPSSTNQHSYLWIFGQLSGSLNRRSRSAQPLGASRCTSHSSSLQLLRASSSSHVMDSLQQQQRAHSESHS